MIQRFRNLTIESKVAVAILALILTVQIALTVETILLNQAADQFHQFKGGVCTLLQKSNDSVPGNKAFFVGQADRARIRLKADQKLGLMTAASADKDAIKQNLKIAHAIKITNLAPYECGSNHTPGFVAPPSPPPASQ